MTSREGFKGAFASTVIIPGPNGQLLIYAADIPSATNLVMALSALGGTDQFGTHYDGGIDLGYNWQMIIQWAIGRIAGKIRSPSLNDVVTDSDHESFNIGGPITNSGRQASIVMTTDNTVPSAKMQINAADGLALNAPSILLGLSSTPFGLLEVGSVPFTVLNGTNSITVNPTFANAFTVAPTVIHSVRIGSNFKIVADLQSVTTTGMQFFAYTPSNANTAANESGNIDYIAIGS